MQASAILSIAILVAIPVQPLAAWFSDVAVKSRKLTLIPITLLECGALGAMVLLAGDNSYILHFASSLILYGFLNTGNPVIFGMVNEGFSPRVKSLMMAVVVLTAYISIAVIQTAFGYILEWSEILFHLTPAEAYRNGMIFLFCLSLLAILASFLMRETFPRSET